MIEKAVTDRDAAAAFATIQELLLDYTGKLKDLMHLIEAANGRLMLALATREDMNAVLAEGKASIMESPTH